MVSANTSTSSRGSLRTRSFRRIYFPVFRSGELKMALWARKFPGFQETGPAGNIVLCSWARHFALTVPLSTRDSRVIKLLMFFRRTYCIKISLHRNVFFITFGVIHHNGNKLLFSLLFVSAKQWCNTNWHTVRELGTTCNEEDLTAIYSELPVFDLPSCSLISSYQFMAKSSKNHALLLSGNNPSVLTNFSEGLKIEVR